MIKVLHYYESFDSAGTERVIFSILNNINKKKFKCYFLSSRPGNSNNILKEIGVCTHTIPRDKNFKYNITQYMKKNSFDIIHVHNCEEMATILKCAKKLKIKKRIVHSHVARTNICKFFWIIKAIKSIRTNYYANSYFACSIPAAKWLFNINYKKAYIMKNGIEINKFYFNLDNRQKIRNSLRIKNTDKVLIMISRLALVQKNQLFALKVMEELLKHDDNFKLLIIGDGNDKNIIQKNICDKGLENSVIMLGSKTDPEKYLSAADAFLMPSNYEGLGISAVESQYNGLMTFCSKFVPKEADIEEHLIQFLDLNVDIWCIAITNYFNGNSNIQRDKIITSRKYDIYEIIKKLEEEYLK